LKVRQVDGTMQSLKRMKGIPQASRDTDVRESIVLQERN
jgi:hypothetical protein